MTKNEFYAKKFRPRLRKNLPAHLLLDRAIRKNRVNKRLHPESAVSSIEVPGSKKIFITNRATANSSKTFRLHRVVAVLTLGKENQLDENISRNIDAYKMFNLQDLSTADNVLRFQKIYLPKTRAFLKKWLPHGNVLIHCRKGLCRSPIVALDYLINVAKVDVDEAASLVVSQRNCIRPTTILLQSIFN